MISWQLGTRTRYFLTAKHIFIDDGASAAREKASNASAISRGRATRDGGRARKKARRNQDERDGRETVAEYKRAAVASNPFAAKGDYVKSSRATIRARRSPRFVHDMAEGVRLVYERNRLGLSLYKSLRGPTTNLAPGSIKLFYDGTLF